jgi:hypothetical protein
MGESPIVVVVDSFHETPVIWWVDVGLSVGFSRLCGAWVLDSTELNQHLADLIGGRITIRTADGAAALRRHHLVDGPVVNAAVTLSRVNDELRELQAMYERKNASLNSARKSTPPLWPALPGPLDIDGLAAPTRIAPTNRALTIATWLMRLSDAWSAIEEQRLLRRYMHESGGKTARLLPMSISALVAVPE